MRRYLLGQTDNNLQGALTLTVPRLGAMLGAVHSGGAQVPHFARGQFTPVRPSAEVPSLPGAFDIVFLPQRGAQVTLQEAANAGAGE